METKNKKQKIPAATEEHAVILDYLSLGYVNSDMSKFKGKAIAQAIGTDYFTLLELVPKRGVDLEIQDTVYIGKGKRDKSKTGKKAQRKGSKKRQDSRQHSACTEK